MSPEARARAAARMKARNADPEFAAAHRERMKARNADPEFAAAHRERMKARHADPEFAARLLGARKGVRDVQVPKWVPRDLWDEFLDIAKSADEFAAARHIRRLLAEERAG